MPCVYIIHCKRLHTLRTPSPHHSCAAQTRAEDTRERCEKDETPVKTLPAELPNRYVQANNKTASQSLRGTVAGADLESYLLKCSLGLNLGRPFCFHLKILKKISCNERTFNFALLHE